MTESVNGCETVDVMLVNAVAVMGTAHFAQRFVSCQVLQFVSPGLFIFKHVEGLYLIECQHFLWHRSTSNNYITQTTCLPRKIVFLCF